MREAIEVEIREAQPADAAELLAVMEAIGAETEFLILDEAGLALTTAELALQLEMLQDSPNNLLLAALVDGKIVGTASVKADSRWRASHIGEIGISILQDYWGFGLGRLMMEEIIDWGQNSAQLYRLELTVQERNQRARRLYEALGFQTEGIMPRGARTDAGEFLTVRLMSLLLN